MSDPQLTQYIDHMARRQEWQPRCRVGRSTDQTIATGSGAAISFDTERWDTDRMWISTDATKVYCRTPGHYIFSANVRFAANATGYRQILIKLNGTTIIGDNIRPNNSGTTNSDLPLATDWVMVEGDYVELIAIQNSGGDLAVKFADAYSPELSMYLK